MRFEVKLEKFPPPDGPLAYNPVPWDSELFGFPFYELKCGATPADRLKLLLPDWLAAIAPRSGPCLAVAALAPADLRRAQILSAHAFYPVETLLEITLALARFKPVLEKKFGYMRMRPAAADDLPALAEIARASFKTDRFHLDGNLPGDKADRRYARWIESGFRDGAPVFVLEDGRAGRAAGFVLARETEPGVYDMSLAALDARYHNTGAGLILYQAMLAASRARGCRLATAWISINNLNSLKAAERLGFTARRAVNKFHWFHGAAPA